MEEGDARVGLDAAQIGGHQPQIVVVHPHEPVLLDLLGSSLSEPQVHFPEDLPIDVLVLEEPRERVQDRPQRLFRGDVIEAFDLLRRQRQPRDEIAAVRVFNVDDPVEIDALLWVIGLPGDPGAGLWRQPVKEALQRRDDPVGALVGPVNDAAVDDDLLIWLPVIDDDQR